QTGVTDRDGRVSLGPLAPGQWVLSAGGGDLAENQQRFRIAPADTDIELRLSLRAAGTVVGWVRDAHGDGAAGLRLQPADWGPPSAATLSDAQGRFSFDEVKPGAYQVRALMPYASERVDVAEGAEAHVELLLPAPARVSGRVTSAGLPLAG